MKRWGRTAAGSQRYRCLLCGITGVRQRPDNQRRYRQALFLAWCTSKQTLTEFAAMRGVTRQTLTAWFQPFWKHPPSVAPPSHPPNILVLDGTSIESRRLMVLIAQDPDTSQPVGWAFAAREQYASWCWFLASLAQSGVAPKYVVCDGQKGLLIALRAVWPQVRIQRCIIHIHRQARLWLTLHPKTTAGQELRMIVGTILTVRTRRQKRLWLRMFHAWLKRHDSFMKERSFSPEYPKRWWYTHRKLRATRSLIRNSIPNLFTYVSHPEVPRTSNHVEGGVNSRLKELLRSHRGISLEKRVALASWYLAFRQGQKSTRNFT